MPSPVLAWAASIAAWIAAVSSARPSPLPLTVTAEESSGTRVSTEAGPMSVHMTYLQIWADLGIFGLLAYLWVTCGWAPQLRRAFLAVRSIGSAEERAIYYNAVFILMFFVFSGFFHPVSTEWSEWIAFAIALGFFSELTGTKAGARKRVFAIVTEAAPTAVYDRIRS